MRCQPAVLAPSPKVVGKVATNGGIGDGNLESCLLRLVLVGHTVIVVGVPSRSGPKVTTESGSPYLR